MSDAPGPAGAPPGATPVLRTPPPSDISVVEAPGVPPEAAARGVLKALSVIAPVTLVTALAYYFGWTATHASADYLGLDESVLGFTTQDYILRSITAIFWPLCLLLAFAAVALRGHSVVSRWRLDDAGRHRIGVLATVLAAAGVITGIYGVLALTNGWLVEGFSIAPLCITAGVALIGYAIVLRNRLTGSGPSDPGSGSPTLPVVLVSMLVAVGLFWEVASWATAVGVGGTQQLIADLAYRPSVTLYSGKDLALTGPGVRVDRVGSKDAAYHFRYTGLRLLFRANDRYFLLTYPWTRSEGSLMVIDDSSDIRLQFTPGTG